ncbi:methyl-accepting chemotaxis protein [Natranaerobius trueperi]|uniref:methyl-accepting chemotaxis protein n=1 Tax=Natranaerobius trueperi TaxID=759412 RepID=UPI0013038A84|nr:methyl-accepting chemotaxis protein [Natranaerobius trueperi]
MSFNKLSVFSIKNKITICFIIVTILATASLATMLILRNNRFIEEEAITEIENDLETFELLLEQEANILRTGYEVISNNDEIISNFSNKDREEINDRLSNIYNDLKSELGTTTLELHNSDLETFYRAHNPSQYGDSQGDRLLLQEVKQTESVEQAFDEGETGFALRVAGPIYDENDNFIGILEIGRTIDSDLLDNIQTNIGSDLTLFQGDTRIATTITDESGERLEGTSIDNTNVIDQIVEEQETFSGRIENVDDVTDNYGAYAPMTGANGESIGMFYAGTSTEPYDNQIREEMIGAITTALIIVIIVAIVSYIIARRIAKPIIEVVKVSRQVADGNLNVSLTESSSRDEIATLKSSFKKMTDNLQEMISQVQESSQQLAASSEELSANTDETTKSIEQVSETAQDLAEGATNQKNHTEKTLETTRNFSAKLQEMAASFEEISATAQETGDKAYKGNDNMNQAMYEMKEINQATEHVANNIEQLKDHSSEISQIVDLINEISEQTNLLALNANIEAARAGEHGKGFAVVADEIRKLAEESKEATEKVTGIITEIQSKTDDVVESMYENKEKVESGTQVVTGGADNFKSIAESINEISNRIEETTFTAESLSSSSEQIVNALKEIEEITERVNSLSDNLAASSEEQASAADEVSSTSDSLAELGDQLQSITNKFNT